MATEIPVVPDGSWPVYNEVERFLMDQREQADRAFLDEGGEVPPSYDDVGRLTRLAADLHSDADHLTALAEDVDALIRTWVAEVRNADKRKAVV